MTVRNTLAEEQGWILPRLRRTAQILATAAKPHHRANSDRL